jgi:hypothetical protein
MEIEYLKDKAKSFLLPREENDYRAKIFSGNFLIFFLIGIAFLKMSFAVFLYSFTGNPFYADVTKTALIDLTNYERAKNSLPPLTENPVLSQAAHMKALDMAQNGYFNHISPSGVNPWHWFSLAGYNYRYAGENLAIGFVDSKEVQDAWTASPSHRANIINEKYREIGIAVLKANFQGNPATIVVQMFGTKSAANKTAAATETKSTDVLPQTAAAPEAGAQQNVMGAATVAADESAAGFKIAAFFANKFYPLAQWLIYLSLAGVILLLAVNFFLKADLAHSDLLAKAAGFTAVMIVFALLDQGLISALIPRNFGI